MCEKQVSVDSRTKIYIETALINYANSGNCDIMYIPRCVGDGYTLDDVRDKINACLPERYMRPVEIFTVPERPFFHFKTNRIGLSKEIIAKRNQQKEKAKRNSFADGCIA